MMRLRTSLIGALLLLASAATAYAECAWVLWLKYELVNVTPGKPVDSYYGAWWAIAIGFGLQALGVLLG